MQKSYSKAEFTPSSERKNLRLVVIGGGPNGVELTGKLVDILGKRGTISLLEKGTEILKNFPLPLRTARLPKINQGGVKIQFCN